MFVYELGGCGFKSSRSHLNFRFRTCFEQGVDIQVTIECGFTLKRVRDMMRTYSQVKRMFIPGPMVSFQRLRNLSSYLVRVRLYPLKWKGGSPNFSGNSCWSFINVSETETFNSSSLMQNLKHFYTQFWL